MSTINLSVTTRRQDVPRTEDLTITGNYRKYLRKQQKGGISKRSQRPRVLTRPHLYHVNTYIKSVKMEEYLVRVDHSGP